MAIDLISGFAINQTEPADVRTNVQTLVARDATPFPFFGMEVFVRDTDARYRLASNLTTWVEIGTGGGGAFLPLAGGTMTGAIDMGVNTITDVKVGNWDTAFGWGDHSTQGYLTSETDSQTLSWVDGTNTLSISGGNSAVLTGFADATHSHVISDVTGLQGALDDKVDDTQVLTNVPSGALFTDTVYTLPFADNSANWNTAFGWGDHSVAGYLTTNDGNGVFDAANNGSTMPLNMVIDINTTLNFTGGNIGIDVAVPASPLTIKTDTGSKGMSILANDLSEVLNVYVDSVAEEVNFGSGNSDFRFFKSLTGHTLSTNHLATISSAGRFSLTDDSADGDYNSWKFLVNVNGAGDRAYIKNTYAGFTTSSQYGLYSTATGANAGTNVSGFFSASNASIGNYALLTLNGGVGFGTLTPTANAHIKTSTFAGDTTVFNVESNTDLFTIKDDGNIGIRNTSPSALLDIKGISGSSSDLSFIARSNIGIAFFKINNLGQLSLGNGITELSSVDASVHVKHAAGQSALFEATTGNVDAMVEAKQAASIAKSALFRATNSVGVTLSLFNNGSTVPNLTDLRGIQWDAGDFVFAFGNTEKGRITSAGDLTIVGDSSARDVESMRQFKSQTLYGQLTTANDFVFDCNLGMVQELDLQPQGADGQLTITNPVEGNTYSLVILQGSGVHNISLPTGWWLNESVFDFDTLADNERALVTMSYVNATWNFAAKKLVLISNP